tara:strand:+ start:29 stop:397 length:369 start_codon:yes stop_codon:yes gene_type:complete
MKKLFILIFLLQGCYSNSRSLIEIEDTGAPTINDAVLTITKEEAEDCKYLYRTGLDDWGYSLAYSTTRVIIELKQQAYVSNANAIVISGISNSKTFKNGYDQERVYVTVEAYQCDFEEELDS